jgi:hypothetical protein
MTSLHRVADAAKKLFFGAIISGIIFIILFFLFRLGLQIKERLHPTPPPPPTASYGKLPPIVFPTPSVSVIPSSFSLNIDTGQLPDFPDRATIYKIQQPQPNLLGFNKIKQLAQSNNFFGDPITISDTQYQWQNTLSPFAKLTIDSLTNNFTLRSNYATDPVVQAAVDLPDQPGAIDIAKAFFDSMGGFPSDIDTGKTQTNIYTIQNSKLIPATSLSTAQLIGVDFFQKDVNKLPIYNSHYPHSTVRALVGSGKLQPQQVIEADFIHNSVSLDENATYPIKTAKEAFSELQKGNSYVANYDGTNTSINILNVSLGYYVGDDQEQYLMPIFVFQGDNNFYAFVSAVTNSWINK